MKIAIVGAGLTGSYLYRLLAPREHTVHLFDKAPATRCGISPCAWGTSKGFAELVRVVGLSPSDYILARSDHVLFDGMKIGAELITFDKKRFIEDLRGDAEIRYMVPNLRDYDRVIDCTGATRAFLPPALDDIVLRCVQYRVRSSRPLENEISMRGIGYSWRFSLSQGEYHVGCGNLILDSRQVLQDLGWIGKGSPHMETICACSGDVRLAAPQFSQPCISRTDEYEVWGVGEAVGCVAPLAGDGIVPGMKSVMLLLKHWGDPAAYTRSLLREFGWMRAERKVIDRLRRRESLGLVDAWTLKRNSKRMSMAVKLWQASALMKHLQ